jgi:tetratricopeptide (TPR) repeat protein
MKALRTVNLIWERRYRGTYPVARYALSDEGTVALALPRPLETRAYDLTHLRSDGGAEVQAGFAVETLLKLEVTPLASDFIGMTADDLYLFRAGSKSRFLGERHISYVDATLSADGQRVVVGFADMAGTSYALALGDISGRVAWTREVSATFSVGALARDGTQFAFGTEEGILRMVDAQRRDVWQFTQEEPVRALACSATGATTAYGTAGGVVALLDAEGARRWEARLRGEIRALALSGDGALCTALVASAEDSSTEIVCLVGEGQVGWEYEVERRLVGLSLSANGRYLATGARDGTATVYEIVPGEAQSGSSATLPDSGARARAEAQAQEGDLEGALRTLHAALHTDPTDAELCTDLIARRDTWREARLAEVRAQSAAGDSATAIALLEAMRQEEPLDAEVVALLEAARRERSQQLTAQAREMVTADPDAAEAALLEAIASTPLYVEARRELAALRAGRAAVAAAEAERLLAEGDLAAGVAALERAQSLTPSPEIAEKLSRAHTAYEFSEGLKHYSEKRYHEAVFQFKKVLARDPDHNEARRYLGYAQKFAQDTATSELTDRFSRLE